MIIDPPVLPPYPTAASTGMTMAETSRAWYERVNALQTEYAAKLTAVGQEDYRQAQVALVAQRAVENAAKAECQRIAELQAVATADLARTQSEHTAAMVQLETQTVRKWSDEDLLRMFMSAALESGKVGAAVMTEAKLQLAAYRKATAVPYTVPV